MSAAADNPVLALAQALIQRASVTPDDAGCQALLAERLQACGFHIHNLPFGEVENLWALRGNSGPLLVFAGHTDVVPPGDLAKWNCDPFQPQIREGLLYGRGAADMKSSLAAMVVAVERFCAQHPQHRGRIGFLITSDEEGPSINGTRKVVEWLAEQGEQIDYCIVGEPSSSQRLADTIKNGRRGSLGAKLSINGKQGHVAYPHLALNPIHKAAAFMAELCALQWDAGNEHFPPTCLQITNVQAGVGADNVIPGSLNLQFNLRFSTETSEALIRQRVEALLQQHGLDHEIHWRLSGLPFLTRPGALLNAVSQAVAQQCGYAPELSTAGGTSDGRFIAPTGAEVVELGPVNASIHKINEHVAVADLEPLAGIYQQTLVNLLT